MGIRMVCGLETWVGMEGAAMMPLVWRERCQKWSGISPKVVTGDAVPGAKNPQASRKMGSLARNLYIHGLKPLYEQTAQTRISNITLPYDMHHIFMYVTSLGPWPSCTQQTKFFMKLNTAIIAPDGPVRILHV